MIREYIIKISDEIMEEEIADRPQELVRCKDCRHGNHIVSTVNGEVTLYRVFCTKPYVERGNATHEPNWFCADGKREE